MLIACAALFGLVLVRAAVRAVRALRAPVRAPAAMTRGLLRPRVVIAPELSARLDERALRAAIEHEAAHARHRDPLRLWLAQIATDLQWPSKAAGQRLVDWRNALELARDAEACDRVEGSDLAAAVIEAARLGRAGHCDAVVGLVSDAGRAHAFSDRIHRLLDPPRETAAAPGRFVHSAGALLAAALGLAVVLGVFYGEAVVRLLPGMLG
jgi:beta-lactamase regulating signal transducer with metallopeptidase domain